MQRRKLTAQTGVPHFIGSWTIEPLSLCDRIIEHFEQNSGQQVSGQTSEGVNRSLKDSTDLAVAPRDLLVPENKIFETYFDELFACYEDYQAQWPFLREMAEEVDIGSFNVQRYERGQHYQGIHCERSNLGSSHRLLAWMTYLNDVNCKDGGATFFHHYDLNVQPEKGLTLIWPAEWTHAHMGSQLLANRKYIVTGWMHFPNS